jgi:hypothetical protein
MSMSGVVLAQDAGQPTAPAAGEQGGEAVDGEWDRLLKLADSMEDRGVEVLERGEGERLMLSYAPEQGRQSRTRMTVAMRTTQTMMGRAGQEMVLPVMMIEEMSEVSEVRDDGVFVVTTTIKDAGAEAAGNANPMQVQQMSQTMGLLPGLELRRVIGANGRLKESSATPPAGAPQGLSEVVSQMTSFTNEIILPDADMGVGGSWRAKYEMTSNGVAQALLATYTVTALDDRFVTLDVDVEQVAPRQQVQNGQLPPGATLTLTRMKGQGDGEMRVDLSNGMAIAGTLNTSAEMNMEVDFQGQTQRMEQQMSTELAIDEVAEGDAETDE